MSEEENKASEENQNIDNTVDSSSDVVHDVPVTGMYKNWFLEYASYVILERAVPLDK